MRRIGNPGPVGLAAAGAAVAVVAVVAALAGIPGRATYGAHTTADEPHYVLTALSLAEDRSLDVSDETAAERWRAFHEVGLPQQASVQADGRQVVPHDPLLPALLAPAVAVGGWVGAKIALALMAGALAALLCWTAVRRFGVPLPTAAAVAALCGASAPFAVYGQQVYPELPAALAVTAAVAALTGPPLRHGGSGAPAPLSTTVAVVAVVALPWLAVKYVPVAAVLAVLALAQVWGPRRTPSARAVVLVTAFAVAGAGYVVGHLVWYDGLTVYAAGDFFAANGGQLSVVGTDPQYLGRSRRLLGLLVGQRFGLAAWQPLWLLMVPALAALLRRRPAGWTALAAPLAAGWLVATFVALTMQGWWFPGRQVVVVLPLAALAIAWWVGAGRARLAAAVALGLLGVWSHAWLAAQTAAGRITWVVDFFATADPWYRVWRLVLPDYLEVTGRTWALHGAWLAVVAVAAASAWRQAGRAPSTAVTPSTSETVATRSR